jgi:hypothetical protein
MSYSFVDIKAKERFYRDVGKLMVEHGFIADVAYWRRISGETIAALFIENYRGGFLFYISLGIYVIGLGEKRTRKPKLGQMHAWCRLRQLIPVTTRANGNIALRGDRSGDDELTNDKIIDDALEAIRKGAFPVLDQLISLEGVKSILDYFGEARWFIKPLLKEKLYGASSVRIRGELPRRDWEIAGSVNPFHKT